MQYFDRDEIAVQIRERAESDPEFRAQLLADPSAAVSALLGMPIPAHVAITVHEELPTDIHLVIPGTSALSDRDLDLVAGGQDWSNYTNPGSRCGCGA
jgi:hypothetical protein